jgi:hypothetical protein
MSARIHTPLSGLAGDANILPRHPADAADWVWHPACAQGRTAFLRFVLEFVLHEPARVRAHISADQRYQLRIDGMDIGFGPDRCDLENWSVAGYELELGAGPHRAEALVWWLADGMLAGADGKNIKPPVAQTSWRGGFLFAAEGEFAALLNTGSAPWQVENLTQAVRLGPPRFPGPGVYHDIGPEFFTDGAAWINPDASVPAVTVTAGIQGNPHGVRRPGWRLATAALPEQRRERVRGGKLRAWEEKWNDGAVKEMERTTRRSSLQEAEDWHALFSSDGNVTIPAHAERTVMWDFEDYVCGYARLETEGGAGARVRVDWAEAPFEAVDSAAKGRRDEIDGKFFRGFGDEFFPTADAVVFPAFWWRSGRYLRVQVKTAAMPLRLRALEIVSTEYPFGGAARFCPDDAGFDAAMAMCERTLRACAHELWVDCPYYEQMAYVGDTRLAALAGYALFEDDRLSRRMLELFDSSRRGDGLVAERAPAGWAQTSVTYSLLWALMVRDFAWWRDDTAFVRACLRGVRAMLDEVAALCDGDGLLGLVPGWPFVDWVPGWKEGCGPGVREGDSSIVNLHWLLALRAATELEDAFGEPELALLDIRRADRAEMAVRKRYWSASDGLLRDTRDASAPFSEHAQALGLLAGLEPPGGRVRWADAWLARRDIVPATIYFSFYVLEALRLACRGGELHRRLGAWRGLADGGLLTLPESPEPTRSDCHCWGAHARWHAVASVAGVRPGASGFTRVVVEPLPGDFRKIEATVRHPRGLVGVALHRDGNAWRGRIVLPEGVGGEWRFAGEARHLHGGINHV